MDLFGIGGPELVVLLFLAGVVLGPRRLAKAAREMGRFVNQIRVLANNLTKELNREIDLLDIAEGKSTPPDNSGDKGAQAAVDSKDPLPEAYRRFRDDFPDEGKLDHLSGESSRGQGQPGQQSRPSGAPGAAQPGDGSVVAPTSLSRGQDR